MNKRYALSMDYTGNYHHISVWEHHFSEINDNIGQIEPDRYYSNIYIVIFTANKTITC
ncbi:MAG: hypothetical protein QXY87_09770 [Saccharolobus sp.]|uniref:Uncharacterized protein n=1 Tax=Saccharolobus shibatae (strain ATCC 51178 / DSM 5389 / JCM 8931 / NBRC 15437 / B12) TaxID=523848 RepID=A0A8F5GU36_SACSH|nr:hypothetical protein [Saccharolobus shibatae]MCH4816822.1 hypothetical protein [Saccharolobus shibatae]QXJ28997.1 hypothetical protein J5U23_01866 [Saccharolobus shibatae B12]